MADSAVSTPPTGPSTDSVTTNSSGTQDDSSQQNKRGRGRGRNNNSRRGQSESHGPAFNGRLHGADQDGEQSQNNNRNRRGGGGQRGRGEHRGRGYRRGPSGDNILQLHGRDDAPTTTTQSSSETESTKQLAHPQGTLAEVAKEGDTADEDEDNICFICANPNIYYSVASCNHRTCHICALRMRALYKTKQCPHCRVS